MKSLALIALLAAPVAAQSFDPIVYGKRFCELRTLSVEADAARKAAMSYAYRSERNKDGLDADVKAATEYVINNCYDSIK